MVRSYHLRPITNSKSIKFWSLDFHHRDTEAAEKNYTVEVFSLCELDVSVVNLLSCQEASYAYFGNSKKYPDDSAESFIVQNLSPYCALWLSRQSEALGETRTVILQDILREWFATHAADVPDDIDAYVPEIAREAVAEFIVRHQEEFLSVNAEQ